MNAAKAECETALTSEVMAILHSISQPIGSFGGSEIELSESETAKSYLPIQETKAADRVN